MTDGYDKPTAYGHIDGIDDPSMGWARYAQVRCLMQRDAGLGTDIPRIPCWWQLLEPEAC